MSDEGPGGPATQPSSTTPEGPGTPSSRTNTKAVIAFVFGLLGVIALPFIGSLVAVILAPVARKEIAADPRQTGDGLALAGLVMGWIMLGLLALVLALLILVVLIALVAFVIALIVHLMADEEDREEPEFPWPFHQAVEPRPRGVPPD